MKILIINWRSYTDPLAGGAERASYEIAKELIKFNNCKVYWISPIYKKGLKCETIDGIEFRYVGLPLSRNIFKLLFNFPIFYISAIYTYFKDFKGKIDVVIDHPHGVPFMTPFYVKEKTVVYIHEIAGEIWKIMYPFPISVIGNFLEIFLLKIYKYMNIKFIANSKSTADDLLSKIGIDPKNVKVVISGVVAPNTIYEKLPHKTNHLQLVYLNRIVKMKGIERALKVTQLVKQDLKNVKLLIIGRGEDGYIKEIKKIIKELKIEKNVEFLGFIDQAKKFKILSESHFIINPSYLEGFGIVNIEANRMGTPAIVFDVKGCKDSVQNNINGFVVPDGNTALMSQKIIEEYNNKTLRYTSWEYSRDFDWGIQSKIFYNELKKTLNS